MSLDKSFNIGDIVALGSHPFIASDSHTSIVLSGEPLHISPLMVIGEITRDTKNHFDEMTGMSQTTKSSSQCKCIWFSTKTQQFEETWISSKLLKVIEAAATEHLSFDELRKMGVGTKVHFITSKMEEGKRKSSLEEKNDYNQGPKKKINALLTFASPILEITGILKSETKEPVFDGKTGNRKREISKLLVKCKFFNQLSDKFSEIVLPVESIKYVEDVLKEDLLYFSMPRQIVYRSKSPRENQDNTLVETGKIYYCSGSYLVDCIDVINGISFDENINDLKGNFHIYRANTEIFSRYDERVDGNGNPILAYGNIPNIAVTITDNSKDVYYKIKYIGRYNGKTTVRYLSNCLILDSSEIIPETEDTYQYLKGWCHSKKDTRYFRLDRVIEIQKYDLKDIVVPSSSIPESFDAIETLTS
ncbi:hypothetical protein CJD36_011960 [Flavipsychrobacter stenotrophus]|uniref:WYL domain-containing protein n=1 Tax=Flavipsychrobacter stenotrophus TaxID=2077091 RepID=A0A2S7SUU2_9BACT|nr:hypothetical protein [Flavipsychrobacter stenotrophus]PQJ10680.1 hypothetical protein CJD36_011960 [Flavipsychrobacter stenotrophus]